VEVLTWQSIQEASKKQKSLGIKNGSNRKQQGQGYIVHTNNLLSVQ